MTTTNRLYRRFMAAFGVDKLEIPATYVKLYRKDEDPPDIVAEYDTPTETVLSCQAVRAASQDEPIWLTRKNIGCVAAAISLGLVDQHALEPLPRPRVYTNIMREQSKLGADFTPPAPINFTNGEVYACRQAGRPEYALFGPADSGRFKDVATAQRAVAQMSAIQPPVMQGVFFYSPRFNECDLIPDVVVMAVRPVELCRILQGYQFLTGETIQAHMGPLRAVDGDLIARPYLSGKMNVSAFCLGARAVTRFEANRMGLGIPFDLFRQVVDGMEQSQTGFPFQRYAGAAG